MSQYLIFQLHGPMASWGVDAPGEVRHTHELPSRSALLGLLAAGVGIRRDDTERLNAFNRHYSLVTFCISKRQTLIADRTHRKRPSRLMTRGSDHAAPGSLSEFAFN